jgi:hypothetical protein
MLPMLFCYNKTVHIKDFDERVEILTKMKKLLFFQNKNVWGKKNTDSKNC